MPLNSSSPSLLSSSLSPRVRDKEVPKEVPPMAGLWRAGVLHEVLGQVLDLHELEGAAGWKGENERVHPCLNSQDLQECFTWKDVWSRQPTVICYDTEALVALLS